MSYLEQFNEIACREISGQSSPPRQPGFITYDEAYHRVKKLQTQKEVGAFMFSIELMKEFIAEIEAYNSNFSAIAPERITDIRAWKAVSRYNANYPIVNDLLMVPVRADGHDAHAFSETVPKYSKDHSKMLMLGSFRPCPNLCGSGGGRKYFHNEDPLGNGPPPASSNLYANLAIPNCEEKAKLDPETSRYIE